MYQLGSEGAHPQSWGEGLCNSDYLPSSDSQNPHENSYISGHTSAVPALRQEGRR